MKFTQSNIKKFDSKNHSLVYIVHDSETKEAIIIDPVAEIDTEKYLDYLEENDLNLKYIVDTHTHHDHVSATKLLKEETGAPIVMHKNAPSPRKDIGVVDRDELYVGNLTFEVLFTPGHTDDHVSLYLSDQDVVFTGDSLLIEGTGRTDFEGGSSEDLYDTLNNVLLQLPDQTVAYPGHEYEGRENTTISHEKEASERIQLNEKAFVTRMDAHTPPLPDRYDISMKKNVV